MVYKIIIQESIYATDCQIQNVDSFLRKSKHLSKIKSTQSVPFRRIVSLVYLILLYMYMHKYQHKISMPCLQPSCSSQHCPGRQWSILLVLVQQKGEQIEQIRFSKYHRVLFFSLHLLSLCRRVHACTSVWGHRFRITRTHKVSDCLAVELQVVMSTGYHKPLIFERILNILIH